VAVAIKQFALDNDQRSPAAKSKNCGCPPDLISPARANERQKLWMQTSAPVSQLGSEYWPCF
jgi:hypothetical protein